MLRLYGIRDGQRSDNLITKDEAFGDRTSHILIPESRSYDKFLIDWRYLNDLECMKLFFIVNQLRDKNPLVNIGLFMPYIPNARMDRTKIRGEVHTLKYFANFINSLRFDYVEVLDAHSDVSLGLLNSVNGYVDRQRTLQRILDEVSNRCLADKPFLVPECVVFPDKSAKTRYEQFFQRDFSNWQIAFCEKKRDWETQQIVGFDIYNLPEKIDICYFLIVDDIISTGSTINNIVKELKEKGAKKIDVYATHLNYFGGFSLSPLYLNDNVRTFYTTDSTDDCSYIKVDKVEVIKVESNNY